MTDTHLGREVGPSPPEHDGITLVQTDRVRHRSRWRDCFEVVHNRLDGQPPVAVSKGWGERPGGWW